MRTITQQELIDIIRYEICGTPLPADFSVSDEDSLISTARKHDLSHLVWDALSKNGIGCSSTTAMQQYYAAIWRAEQMSHELKSMTDLFEREGIDFMPLKGAVMRTMYPEPWMRTSADIDVLFREEDFERACGLAETGLGYREDKEDKGQNHLSFHSPANDVHIEMHHRLFADHQIREGVIAQIPLVWEQANPAHGHVHLMRMSDACFYFYHVAHMAKHMDRGGNCPVRSLIDLWILNSLPERDETGRRELIENAGLATFTDMMSATAKAWLEGGDAPSEELEQYIIAGYMYGDLRNRVALGIESGGVAKYILRKIFLPYDTIKYAYPVLQKHRWLTPFFQIVRWTRVVRKRNRDKLKRRAKAILQADSVETDDIELIGQMLELRDIEELPDD